MFKIEIEIIDGTVSDFKHYVTNKIKQGEGKSSIKYSMVICDKFCVIDLEDDKMIPIRENDRLVASIVKNKNKLNDIIDYKNLTLNIYHDTIGKIGRAFYIFVALFSFFLGIIAICIGIGSLLEAKAVFFIVGIVCIAVGLGLCFLCIYTIKGIKITKKCRQMINDYLKINNLQ